MKAKVIVAQATPETAATLGGLVAMVAELTAIKAYPNAYNGAVFFPKNKYDREFVKRILTGKQIAFRVEARRKATETAGQPAERGNDMKVNFRFVGAISIALFAIVSVAVGIMCNAWWHIVGGSMFATLAWALGKESQEDML